MTWDSADLPARALFPCAQPTIVKNEAYVEEKFINPTKKARKSAKRAPCSHQPRRFA